MNEEAGGTQQADGRDTTGGRPQTSGRGAAGGRLRTSRRDVAGSSHQVGGRGATGSGVEAPGDKGKCPRSFVPQPSSSSSPLPPRQWPTVGGTKEGGQGGQSSGAASRTEARPPKDPAGDATGSRLQTSGRGAAGGRLRTSRRDAACSSHQAAQGPRRRPEAARSAEAGSRAEELSGGGRGEGDAGVTVVEDPKRLCKEGSQGTQHPAAVKPGTRTPPGCARKRPKVIERLEAAVAAERAELDRDRAVLIEVRGRLEEVGRPLEARIASACATHKRSMRAVAKEGEALEEVHDEAIAA
ncbi:uncharacterized protein LOC133898635 [Phragmites australis]|uniref:uncharacterized protein LOC133898635 n=1 Tax=Phragmites australis TaxID=29695 RepID=UPI002D7946BD|nr:uncharacterized protein LOC133898635 [Phragmites australis]